MLVDQVRVCEPDGFVVGLAVLQKAVVGSFYLAAKYPPLSNLWCRQNVAPECGRFET